ncbi:MAG: radical SAM protein [Myxococcota bacterium]
MKSGKFEYLRLSIIDRCNLRCLYCKPQRTSDRGKKGYITPSDIKSILNFFVKIGTRKLRITGGEPLLRDDISDIIRIISSFPEIKDIGLTTNGILLAGVCPLLSSAGLRRINISLPSLLKDRYKYITGTDIEYVMKGIDTALDNGIKVKLNMVAYGEEIFEELPHIVKYLSIRELELRFIEYMPLCTQSYQKGAFVPSQKIEDALRERFGFVYAENGNQIVSRRYFRDDIRGQIGFIKPITQPFCNICNKVRVNCYGYLTTCLFSNNYIDILGLIKGSSFEYAREQISKFTIQNDRKPDIQSIFEGKIISSRAMVEIGG